MQFLSVLYVIDPDNFRYMMLEYDRKSFTEVVMHLNDLEMLLDNHFYLVTVDEREDGIDFELVQSYEVEFKKTVAKTIVDAIDDGIIDPFMMAEAIFEDFNEKVTQGS
jgi:hypothetical protein